MLNTSFEEKLTMKKGSIFVDILYFPDPLDKTTITFKNELLVKYYENIDLYSEINIEPIDIEKRISILDLIQLKLKDRNISLKELSNYHRIFLIYIPNIRFQEYKNVLNIINNHQKPLLIQNTIPIICYEAEENGIDFQKEMKLENLLFLPLETKKLSIFSYKQSLNFGCAVIEKERVVSITLYDCLEKVEYIGEQFYNLLTFIPSKKENIYSEIYPSFTKDEIQYYKDKISEQWNNLGINDELKSIKVDMMFCVYDPLRRSFFKKFSLKEYASPSFIFLENISQLNSLKTKNYKRSKWNIFVSSILIIRVIMVNIHYLV